MIACSNLLSWEEWRLGDSEFERIDLESAASPEEADELKEMTADEMAVDGYYVVAGIARQEYKKGWKFLTLWNGFGLFEATWEPMSAFIQPDGSIDPIFRSYLVENSEGQLLTCAAILCPSGRRRSNILVPIYVLCLTKLRMLQASGGGGIPQTPPPPVYSLLRATPAGVLAPPGGTLPPHQGRSNTVDRWNTTRPLILFAFQWSVCPIAPACHHTFSAQSSTKNAPTRWTRYPWGWFSPGCPPPYDHLNSGSGSPEHAGLREQIPLRLGLTVAALYSQPPLFSNLPGAVSTLVLMARPTQCVPGHVQESCRAPVTMNVLTATLNRVRHSRHLHVRCLQSTAPAPDVLCSPMPMVTSVSHMAAYQVFSHPASVCLVDHVVHGNCPDVMTLGSQRRAVA